jgi:predicted transcriptional regulator
MPEQKPIGQILMESGMITIDDLNDAIEIQKSSSQRLGEILIGMGAITEEELQLALEFQED